MPMQCNAMPMQCNAMPMSMQCNANAMQCNAMPMQCIAMQCRASEHAAKHDRGAVAPRRWRRPPRRRIRLLASLARSLARSLAPPHRPPFWRVIRLASSSSRKSDYRDGQRRTTKRRRRREMGAVGRRRARAVAFGVVERAIRIIDGAARSHVVHPVVRGSPPRGHRKVRRSRRSHMAHRLHDASAAWRSHGGVCYPSRVCHNATHDDTRRTT